MSGESHPSLLPCSPQSDTESSITSWVRNLGVETSIWLSVEHAPRQCIKFLIWLIETNRIRNDDMSKTRFVYGMKSKLVDYCRSLMCKNWTGSPEGSERADLCIRWRFGRRGEAFTAFTIRWWESDHCHVGSIVNIGCVRLSHSWPGTLPAMCFPFKSWRMQKRQ